MKTEEMLKKYFRKRVRAIAGFLQKPAKEFTPENFHNLRVEIKKLRAFFKVVNFCAEDFKMKKTLKPLKTIFVQAGKVRELQLEAAALKKYAPHDSLNDYINYLEMLQVKERKLFFSLIQAKVMQNLERKYAKVIPFLKKTDKKCLNLYIERKRKKIESLFKKKSIRREQVHELRKRLKELYYLRKFVDRKGENKLDKKTDAFQELLGQWHDSMVLDAHLKKAIDWGAEIELLEKMHTRFFSDGEELFNKINVTIQELPVL